MKKIRLWILASIFLGLGTTSYTVVTHIINNTSNRAIETEVYYRGRVDWLKSCRPDVGTIQPGQSLISKAGGCLLRWVQIKDGDKIIKMSVANASANIAKEVGLGVLGSVLVGTAILGTTAMGLGVLAMEATGEASAIALTLAGTAVGLPSLASLQSLSSEPNNASMISKIYELVVYAGTSTTWEYDGTFLKPTNGVRVYEVSDFTKSN